MLVEAFVAELAIEAFDVAVLHRPARLDQQMFDAMALRPGDEGTAGELRPIVGSYRAGITAEAGGPIQHANHIGTADAVVHGDVDAFVAEVVGDGQALESTPIGQRITDEVHAPDRVGLARWRQRLTLARRPLGFPAPAYGQIRLAVQAVDLLVVHVGELRAQQVVQAAIAKPAANLGQFDDPG